MRSSHVIIARNKAVPHRASSILMANKVPNLFDIEQNAEAEDLLEEGEDEDDGQKRSVFQRMRKRIASSLGRNKEENEKEEPIKKGETGYKTNVVDLLRLRMAMAMSGVWNRTFNRPEEWVVACPKTMVGPGQIIPCVVSGLDIIIFASRDGSRLDAFANSCPHLGSPFDLGTVQREPLKEGRPDDGAGDGCVDCIVCPVHQTAFAIQSGEVLGEWCPYPPILGNLMGLAKKENGLVKFAVRLRGKNVEVRIATPVENVNNKDEDARGVKGMN